MEIRAMTACLLPICAALVQGCTHLKVEDCGGEVIGENQPRIRSSHFRMLLADLPAASARFAPYAAMSALAYAEDSPCGQDEAKIDSDESRQLNHYLAAAGWKEDRQVLTTPDCEDDKGLFLRVWTRHGEATQVVLAFRGTWGGRDWLYGNLHWLTRFLPMDDQYSRTRTLVQRMVAHYSTLADRPVQFVTTGHSLGGGLAQHALYSFPKTVLQAIAFNPSSVTGFVEQPRENKVAGCECDDARLAGEPRIYRVYDAYEILSNLRIFHKIFFPPERHVQEVRFPNAASHSMKGLAFYLMENAGNSLELAVPWYSGKGYFNGDQSCTAAFMARQKASCDIRVAPGQWNVCAP